MVRTANIVALTACALLLLLPAGAGAHRFSAPTTAEIESGDPGGAGGTVDSPKRFCWKNRLVELFRVNELGGEDQSFGTDRTDVDGDWSIDAPLVAGDYYVTVEKTGKKKAGKKKAGKKKPAHRHRCKAGRSLTLTL